MVAQNSDDRVTIVTARFGAAGSRRGLTHKENEDKFGAFEPDAGDVRMSHGNLYVVADGVGGHLKGEVASALAVKAAGEAFFASEDHDPVQNLLQAINQANLAVHQTAEADTDEGPGMATTIVAAAVTPDQIVVANVGDSRAYVVEEDALRQLSHDHSWVQEQLESGRMTPEEARSSPRRNIITRALGLADEVEAELKQEPEPQTKTRLLLCTDGVHGVVNDEELHALIKGQDPLAAVERILGEVDTRRGRDDATLIIVDLAGPVQIVAEERPSHQPGFFLPFRRLFRRRR